MIFEKDKIVGKVEIVTSISEYDVEVIMVNAIEGGIGYWACLLNDKPEFANKPKGCPVSQWAAKLLIEGKSVYFMDEFDGFEYNLTLEKLLNGIKLNKMKRSFDSDWISGDSTTADCIIQYSILGEVEYC